MDQIRTGVDQIRPQRYQTKLITECRIKRQIAPEPPALMPGPAAGWRLTARASQQAACDLRGCRPSGRAARQHRCNQSINVRILENAGVGVPAAAKRAAAASRSEHMVAPPARHRRIQPGACSSASKQEQRPSAPEDSLLAIEGDAAALLREQLLIRGRQLPPCAGMAVSSLELTLPGRTASACKSNGSQQATACTTHARRAHNNAQHSQLDSTVFML